MTAPPPVFMLKIHPNTPIERVRAIREGWSKELAGTELEGAKLLMLDSNLTIEPMGSAELKGVAAAVAMLRERGWLEAAADLERIAGTREA